MPTLQEQLKEYRDKHGLNQPQMAELLSIGYRTYQSIEKTGEVKKIADLQKINEIIFEDGKDASTINRSNTRREMVTIESDYLNLLKNGISHLDILLKERTKELSQKDKIIEALIKANTELKTVVQSNLETLAKDQATANFLQEAFHEQILKMLHWANPQLVDGDADELISRVYRDAIGKMSESNRRGS